MTRFKRLPCATIKRGELTLHANATFRTKSEAVEHARRKRSQKMYARVVDNSKVYHGSQGGWWVYVAYKPEYRRWKK